LKFYEIYCWIGLAFWIAACSCLALIALRNSVFGGPSRSLLENLRPFDIKLAKIGGVLFISGIFFFIIGVLVH